jgi:hypothetical protein
MQAPHHQPGQRSTPARRPAIYRASRRVILIGADVAFREAGRAGELSVDPSVQRVGRVAFAIASRLRSDRLAAA